MMTCPACKELITPNSSTYKASSGFIDLEGNYFEDKNIIVHRDCCYEYLYNPFDELEEDLKNS